MLDLAFNAMHCGLFGVLQGFKSAETLLYIERLHSVPGELDNKEDGGHIGVPDKNISSKFFCLGTPTCRGVAKPL